MIVLTYRRHRGAVAPRSILDLDPKTMATNPQPHPHCQSKHSVLRPVKDRRNWILGDCVGNRVGISVWFHVPLSSSIATVHSTLSLWKPGRFELFNHPTEPNIVLILYNSSLP